jgi:hypothetical protein
VKLKSSAISAIPWLAVILLLAPAALLAAQEAPIAKPLAGYTTIVVEKFTIENNAATENFPRGYETVMQNETIRRLEKKALFERVVDAAEAKAESDPAPDTAAEPGKTLVLSGTVVTFDKGSRAARYLVGFGAGATKIKVRFVLRDASSGQNVLEVDRQGKFYGVISFVGGSQSQADSKSARSVVAGLIKVIAKNR